MNILVTGGAGYIGSHTVIKLIEAGHVPIVVDNLCNSSAESLRRVAQITGVTPQFYQQDVRDTAALETVFAEHAIDAVIHFAGLKAVGESTEKPLLYYQTNLDSTFALLEVMRTFNVKTLVFSSSATVYGSEPAPYSEDSPIGRGITNPYGRTKYFIEEMLRDIASSDDSLAITSLRYFNPIGAHPSGLIGENPNGVPNNLMPYITQVAVGKRAELGVFGDDYDTVDGTGVRDYIHVDDLAEGHVAALTHSQTGYHAINLGSGEGTSVLELVRAFEEASGAKVPYKIHPRRPGDVAVSYAKTTRAADVLQWRTTRTIEDACRDSWKWQSSNPEGYKQPMEMNFCRRCGTPLTHLQNHVYECENKHILFANASPSTGIFFVTEDNQVLLSVRGIEPHKGALDAFGGFCDGAEALETAVARELEEELGLKPGDYTAPEYLTSGVGNYPYKNETLPVLSSFFWARLLTEDFQPQDDVAEVATYPLAEVPLEKLHDEDIVAGIKALQQKLLR